MNCRCTALAEVFDLPAGSVTKCSWCRQVVEARKLSDRGFMRTMQGRMQAYLDCGVPVRTATYQGEHVVWVPVWAENLVDVLLGEALLGPILCVAAESDAFRGACASILRLAAPDKKVGALIAYAASQGVHAPKID